jgi:hypothetical protein
VKLYKTIVIVREAMVAIEMHNNYTQHKLTLFSLFPLFCVGPDYAARGELTIINVHGIAKCSRPIRRYQFP